MTRDDGEREWRVRREVGVCKVCGAMKVGGRLNLPAHILDVTRDHCKVVEGVELSPSTCNVREADEVAARRSRSPPSLSGKPAISLQPACIRVQSR